jgi:hypothetical protein
MKVLFLVEVVSCPNSEPVRNDSPYTMGWLLDFIPILESCCVLACLKL